MTAEQTFKPNSRVVYNCRKATIRVIHRDRAMIQFDTDPRGKGLTMVLVADLALNRLPDTPRDPRRFHLGYIQGVDDASENAFYCQSLTGNDWSIGYRKGWDDAKAENIRSFGNQPFIECGGRL